MLLLGAAGRPLRHCGAMAQPHGAEVGAGAGVMQQGCSR